VGAFQHARTPDIEFRILDHQDKVDLVDTTFPAGRNDALQWNIKSQMAGKIPVEIRCFTSGLTWSADYVGIANEDETKLNVTGYVRVPFKRVVAFTSRSSSWKPLGPGPFPLLLVSILSRSAQYLPLLGCTVFPFDQPFPMLGKPKE
jgi:hypothetical protein